MLLSGLTVEVMKALASAGIVALEEIVFPSISVGTGVVQT